MENSRSIFWEKMNRKKIKSIVSFLCLFGLFFIAIKTITYELWQMYQVPKDIFFYAGMIWILVIIGFIRKISYKQIEVWATIILGGISVYTYLKISNINAATYGPDYSKVIVLKCICYVLFAALGADTIRSIISKKLSEKRPVIIVVISILLFAIGLAKASAFPFVIPIVALLATPLEKEEWIAITDCFSVGYYIAFCYLITKSFLASPVSDVVEAAGERYSGLFVTNENVGVFAGGAVLCVIYLFVRIKECIRKNLIWVLAPIVFAIYPIYALLQIDSKTTDVAVLVVIFFAVIFLVGKKDKKSLLMRGLISAATLMLLLLLFYVVAVFTYRRYVTEDLPERHHNLISKIAMLADPNEANGYFGENSFLNNIDAFTNRRLQIYAEFSKQITWKGHSMEYIKYKEFTIPDPHNIFIEALIEMGIVRGVLLISMLIYTLVACVLRVSNEEKAVIMPLLWIPYSMVVTSGTILGWRSLIPFFMLFFMYPVVDCVKKNESNLYISASE